MICYKDMTFCAFKDCEHFGDRNDDPDNCFRSLTDVVKKNAERRGLPIAQYTEPPDCFEDKNKVENDDNA